MVAERHMRSEIEARAAMAKKLQRLQKEHTEEELRQLAAAAASNVSTLHEREIHGYDESLHYNVKEEADAAVRRPSTPDASHSLSPSHSIHDHSDDEGRVERDRIRRERQRELAREMRLEARKQERGTSSLLRDRERDVSEKIALGQTTGSKPSHDGMYDSRLFNQDAGLTSGFGGDDSYGVYDRPTLQFIGIHHVPTQECRTRRR